MLSTSHSFGVLVFTSLLGSLAGCAGGGSCPEGSSKNADTSVCMKLSADLKYDDKVQKLGDSTLLRVSNPKTLQSFSVWIEKPDDLDKRAKAVAGMAGGDLKLVESGDTSPNKGKFYHYHNTKGNYEFAVALVPGKEHFYRCEIQNTKIEDAKAMIEACKTIGGP